MEWFSVEDRLPDDGKYVLVKHNLDNWHDQDHPEGVQYKVVKFVRGISKQERELMKLGYLPDPVEAGIFGTSTVTRSMITRGEDEDGNNLKPYHWEEFGPGSFFGQEVDYWAHLVGPSEN